MPALPLFLSLSLFALYVFRIMYIYIYIEYIEYIIIYRYACVWVWFYLSIHCPVPAHFFPGRHWAVNHTAARLWVLWWAFWFCEEWPASLLSQAGTLSACLISRAVALRCSDFLVFICADSFDILEFHNQNAATKTYLWYHDRSF